MVYKMVRVWMSGQSIPVQSFVNVTLLSNSPGELLA